MDTGDYGLFLLVRYNVRVSSPKHHTFCGPVHTNIFGASRNICMPIRFERPQDTVRDSYGKSFWWVSLVGIKRKCRRGQIQSPIGEQKTSAGFAPIKTHAQAFFASAEGMGRPNANYCRVALAWAGMFEQGIVERRE